MKDLDYQGEPISSNSPDIDNVLINIKQDNISSMVVNGAVAHPIDYELLFENRNFTGNNDKIHYETNAMLSMETFSNQMDLLL